MYCHLRAPLPPRPLNHNWLIGRARGSWRRATRVSRVQVSFEELLKLFYRYARPDEIATMLSWVAPEPEPEPEPKPELSKEVR